MADMVRLKFLRLSGGAALAVAAFGATDAEGVTLGETISLPSNPLHGVIAVSVSVSPTRRLQGVELFVNNQSLGVDMDEPFAFVWDTTTVDDGTHTVRADAVYPKRRHSATLTVVVNNSPIRLFPNPSLYPTETLVI